MAADGHDALPEAPAPAPPGRRRSVRAGIVLAVLLGGAGLLSVGAWWVTAPPEPVREEARLVEIPPQQGVVAIAELLADQGVIRSPLAFIALTVLRGTARSLKAGEYEVPPGTGLLATIRLLEAGRVRPHVVVLPEGFTVRDLARVLEAEGLARSEDVLRLAEDPRVARGLGLDASGLEGYLFPDTYRLTRGMRTEEILTRMVQRFRERVGTPETLARAQARALSLHQVVTLASIVEKEAVVSAERPVIARVFLNRLRVDMPLQADPTVAYAVGKDGRPPSRDDLQVDHPFNTYRYRGLPPGPIGSPGQAAVESVLTPADVPYLYFVAVDDRQHHFSTTLEEHNQAVARYRQYRRQRAGLRPGSA